jgi:RNA polymerase sigma-70 factor (ECF subfamily)
VRAKAKIKANGIRFEEPEAGERPQRVAWVLEAIYGAYTLDWDHEAAAAELAGADSSLAAEALYLAELVAALMPHDAEALGLLALLELNESRRAARTDAAGVAVPLHEQDAAAWDTLLIERAAAHLTSAAALRRPGPFQLEAAIQMAHASRRHGGPTPWSDIVQLYEGLLALHPNIGAAIGHALASAYSGGDAVLGLQLLQAVDAERRQTHQPWWAAQAHLLERAGARPEALAAYERALALTQSEGLRRTLAARQRALAGRPH